MKHELSKFASVQLKVSKQLTEKWSTFQFLTEVKKNLDSEIFPSWFPFDKVQSNVDFWIFRKELKKHWGLPRPQKKHIKIVIQKCFHRIWTWAFWEEIHNFIHPAPRLCNACRSKKIRRTRSKTSSNSSSRRTRTRGEGPQTLIAMAFNIPNIISVLPDKSYDLLLKNF